MTGPTDFLFLSEPGSLEEIGWDGPQREKLWRYNQHYFDDLNADASEARRQWHLELLSNWVTSNQPAHGTGWEPYPTSLRIVNWIKWVLGGNELPESVLHSLAVQTRWLTRRLERHLLGNHLLSNAKALVFSGLFFAGDEADGWLRLGMRILREELAEQLLHDGGHFELSTMYHAIVFEDLVDLCNLAHAFPDARGIETDLLNKWYARATSMRDWLLVMSHPDGGISFFNDAALGIAPDTLELLSYFDRVVPDAVPAASATQQRSPRFHHLAASGYIRIEAGPVVAMIDVAAVGPSYLPGHAHADTLSMELSVDNSRVFVNGGTSLYGDVPERRRQRGTAAHNTVVVANEDSSEVWSSFRVARRAHPFGLQIQEGGESNSGDLAIACSHDGYRRLTGRPIHRRKWSFTRSEVVVDDSIAPSIAPAEARYHLHPDVGVELNEQGTGGTLRLPNGRHLSWSAACESARLEASTWHPRFGDSQPSTSIVLRLLNGQGLLRLRWQDD